MAKLFRIMGILLIVFGVILFIYGIHIDPDRSSDSYVLPFHSLSASDTNTIYNQFKMYEEIAYQAELVRSLILKLSGLFFSISGLVLFIITGYLSKLENDVMAIKWYAKEAGEKPIMERLPTQTMVSEYTNPWNTTKQAPVPEKQPDKETKIQVAFKEISNGDFNKAKNLFKPLIEEDKHNRYLLFGLMMAEHMTKSATTALKLGDMNDPFMKYCSSYATNEFAEEIRKSYLG